MRQAFFQFQSKKKLIGKVMRNNYVSDTKGNNSKKRQVIISNMEFPSSHIEESTNNYLNSKIQAQTKNSIQNISPESLEPQKNQCTNVLPAKHHNNYKVISLSPPSKLFTFEEDKKSINSIPAKNFNGPQNNVDFLKIDLFDNQPLSLNCIKETNKSEINIPQIIDNENYEENFESKYKSPLPLVLKLEK